MRENNMNVEYKTVWTDRDFEIMSWHDVMIHALAVIPREYDYEIMMDIDYLFEWIHPEPPDNFYSFLLAPATLSFSGVWDVNSQISTRIRVLEPLQIRDIQRTNERRINNSNIVTWDWIVTLLQGSINFNGPGFTQHIRQKPIKYGSHILPEEQRGPISFSKEFKGA
jgi:hypothetical protein